MKKLISTILSMGLAACNQIGASVAHTNNDTPLFLVVDVPQSRWNDLKSVIQKENEDGFRAYVRFVDGPEFIGATEVRLRGMIEKDSALVIFAVDEMTFQHPESPLLAIDPTGGSPSFRVKLRDLWAIENNVSLGSVLFEEFVDDQVSDGWFDGMDE